MPGKCPATNSLSVLLQMQATLVLTSAWYGFGLGIGVSMISTTPGSNTAIVFI